MRETISVYMLALSFHGLGCIAANTLVICWCLGASCALDRGRRRYVTLRALRVVATAHARARVGAIHRLVRPVCLEHMVCVGFELRSQRMPR